MKRMRLEGPQVLMLCNDMITWQQDEPAERQRIYRPGLEGTSYLKRRRTLLLSDVKWKVEIPVCFS